MRILHHFGFRLESDDERRAFEEIGVDLPKGVRLPHGGISIRLDIAEDDPRWRSILDVVHQRKTTDFVLTEFSADELNAAKFLVMFATSHRGYPQPENEFGFLSATYDLKDYCQHCGIGLKQIAPFRFKGSPVLQNEVILQLNWVFDEFFVAPDVWESIFRPFAIGCRFAVANKSGDEIHSIVQLDVQSTCDVEVETLDTRDCSVCSRRKYLLIRKGYCPAPISNLSDMAKSHQLFGDGADPSRLVIVSQALYRKIKDAGLKGVEFYPCAQ
jgi:hypothetical protein